MAVKRLKQLYRKDFSEDDIELIISSYQSGNTTIDLAEQFGCSKGTINKLLRKCGVNVTKAKAQAKLDDRVVIAMYKEERHTIEEIAQHFGVSSYTVVSTSGTGGTFKLLGNACPCPTNNLASINGTAPAAPTEPTA